MTKRPRVPETRDQSPNREQRRHPDRAAPVGDEPLAREEEAPEVFRRGPQDVASTRAKSSGHKKKTADNWNQ
jgi:hypothetical protein